MEISASVYMKQLSFSKNHFTTHSDIPGSGLYENFILSRNIIKKSARIGQKYSQARIFIT